MAIYNCNVSVIGGAGFLGSHLVRHLVKDRGCNVLVLDNLHSGHAKHLEFTGSQQKVALHHFDLGRSPLALLKQILAECKAEWVFNYAAHPYIPECYASPRQFIDTNFVGVLDLLTVVDELRDQVHGTLQVGSAEIYGNDGLSAAVDERFAAEPRSTYGVAKLAADHLVQVRWRENQTQAMLLRQFNCIGERETHEYVVPEIIRQILPEKNRIRSTIQLGNNSRRDFIYAGDAVRMAAALLESRRFGECYNLGSEDDISIYDLARLIYDTIHVRMGIEAASELSIVEDPGRKRKWEIWHLKSDNSKLYETISTRPSVTLAGAIWHTIDYYINNGYRWDFRQKELAGERAVSVA